MRAAVDRLGSAAATGATRALRAGVAARKSAASRSGSSSSAGATRARLIVVSGFMFAAWVTLERPAFTTKLVHVPLWGTDARGLGKIAA